MDNPTNKVVIYIIVSTIATLAFACVASICVLSYLGIQIPPELNTLAGGSVGSLASMLVKTSPSQTTTQVAVQDQPTVVNAEKPDDPNKPKT